MPLRPAPALLLALAVLPPLAATAVTPSTYVLTSNHLNEMAWDNAAGIAADGDFYNSGNLPQNSDSDSETATAEGNFTASISCTPQGAITTATQVGELHALVTAEANTSNYYYGDLSQSTARSSSASYTAWFDTVTFFTNNPAGSLFTAEIYLNDAIINIADASMAAGYSAGSYVRAALDIQGLPVIVSHPTLTLDDNEFLNNNGTLLTLPDSFDRNYTFLIQNGTRLTFLESLDITTGASGGDTKSTVDVQHTAHFALYTSDPSRLLLQQLRRRLRQHPPPPNRRPSPSSPSPPSPSSPNAAAINPRPTKSPSFRPSHRDFVCHARGGPLSMLAAGTRTSNATSRAHLPRPTPTFHQIC